jgi:acetylornithine deacetylase/succinyl-diaminopimelate desuccinylase-like protein
VTPQEYIESHHDSILEKLIEFARMPSVSTDPAYAEGMQQAADWVLAQLQEAGIDARIVSTQGHPVVYGEWRAAPDAPTICIYGHYDVQPPDPLDKWQTSPFEPTIRDGRLYGRGVSDDKGPMLIPLVVAQAFMKTEGKLPVNVRFVFEGEEEIGSPSLEPLMRQQPDLFKADFVLSADGAMWRINEPSITVASRGMTGLEFRLQGAAKDLHSGRHGGAVANPLHAIAQLIDSLHHDDGRVAVAGFYDAVHALSESERQALRDLPYDGNQYLQSIGASAQIGEPGYSILEQQWTRPTLEVNGMWGGYQGPGSKSVIPNEAFAKITCRLVPDQNPDDIREKVAQHLRDYCPPGVTLEIHSDKHGAPPYRIPEDHIGLQVAQKALYAVYQQQPLTVRMGGTLPIAASFKQLFDMEMVFFSFSTADEDFHAPNEFFRIQRLYDGLQAWLIYWQMLSNPNSQK